MAQRRTVQIGNAADASQMAHDDLNFGFSGGYELRIIPPTIASGEVGENGAERIVLGERFPIVLELVEIHQFPVAILTDSAVLVFQFMQGLSSGTQSGQTAAY